MRSLVLKGCLAVGVGCCLTLVSLRAESAPAEDPESLIRQGVELRRQGKEVRAEGYIRRAYELAATPRTAAQLGLVELALDEYAEAEQHLSEALRKRDPWVASNRETLEASRATARKHLLRVELVSAPKGTTFAVEGGDAAALPADGLLWVAPAVAVTLRLEAAGHKPAELSVTGAAGESRRVVVDMPAVMAPPPAAPPPLPVAAPSGEGVGGDDAAREDGARLSSSPQETTTSSGSLPSAGRGLRIAGIAVAAVGVGVGVVGAVLVSKGLAKRDATLSYTQNYDPKNENWDTLRDAGVACIIGGAVAVVGGVGLYVFGRRAASEGGAAVSFVPGPGSGVVAFRGRF
jgi:hypothetical protein